MKYQDVIDRLPGEMNDNPTGSSSSISSSNKKAKTTTADDSTNVNSTNVETHQASSIMQPLYKSTGMDSINNDECKITDQIEADGRLAIPLHEENNEQGIMNNVDERKPSAIQTDFDCDSTSCFSEGDDNTLSEDDVDDDDEPSIADIERAKQQSKILSDILRDDEMYESIFGYIKQYELCCLNCHCNPPCPEAYDSACLYKEVLPSQTSSSSVYARIHRWCCPDIHSLDEYDQEYARTNYFNALCGGCKEERTKNGIFHVNNSFLLKAKKNANRLKTTEDNNMYKGKLLL